MTKEIRKEKQRNSHLELNFCITNLTWESWYIFKIIDVSTTLIKGMFHSIYLEFWGYEVYMI